jgi:hypothetical protein
MLGVYIFHSPTTIKSNFHCEGLGYMGLGFHWTALRSFGKVMRVVEPSHPTLGAHTHAHAHPYPWVLGGHGCDVIVHGWAWVNIGFVHPYIQLQIGVKLLGCREYANQEALRAKANDSERPLIICPIQPRLGVGG